MAPSLLPLGRPPFAGPLTGPLTGCEAVEEASGSDGPLTVPLLEAALGVRWEAEPLLDLLGSRQPAPGLRDRGGEPAASCPAPAGADLPLGRGLCIADLARKRGLPGMLGSRRGLSGAPEE